MEFQSLTEMVNALSLRTRDGGHSKWSYLEKIAALQEASRAVQGKFAVEALYTSLSLNTTNYDYAIPAYIDRVVSVERRWSGVTLTGDSLYSQEWKELPWFEVRPTPQTNFIYVDRLYTQGDVRVWYLQDQPALPPAQMTLALAVTPSQTTIPVGMGVSSLSVLDYAREGYFALVEGGKKDVIHYEGVSDTSFLSCKRVVRLTTHSFSAGTIVDPVMIMDRGGAGYEYLLSEAQALLYEWLLSDGSTMDRSAEQFLVRWRDQKTAMLAQILQQHRRPGSIRIGKRGRF